MKANHTIPVLAAAVALCVLIPTEGRAELVKRSMYTNSAGGKVSQYVYQGGKSGRSRYSRSRSYGYGCYPYYYSGGYYRSGTHLNVRRHYSHRGHVHGSYSGGRVHVRIGY